jgi:hypothetical protein
MVITERTPLKLTEEAYHDLDNSYQGVCLNCGEYQDGVEPDAENYYCESCEQDHVFGVEELLIMGLIEITG